MLIGIIWGLKDPQVIGEKNAAQPMYLQWMGNRYRNKIRHPFVSQFEYISLGRCHPRNSLFIQVSTTSRWSELSATDFRLKTYEGSSFNQHDQPISERCIKEIRLSLVRVCNQNCSAIHQMYCSIHVRIIKPSGRTMSTLNSRNWKAWNGATIDPFFCELLISQQ